MKGGIQMVRFFNSIGGFKWIIIVSMLLVFPLEAGAARNDSGNKKEPSRSSNSKKPSRTPAPTPVPTPEPAPADPAESGDVPVLDDSGVSEAPIAPVDTRIVVVAKDGTGKYRSIQSALNNARPGDTIQVKDGVYVERVNFVKSGTAEKPIALVNYPGHAPVIDPGNGRYPTECCPDSGTPRVEFNAEWTILKGFEIRYGWEGIKVYKGHNTIEDNWIHHNKYGGILLVSTSDVLIRGNVVEENGIDPEACPSGKNCHGIYMSDYFCTGISNITIKRNVVNDHPGRGIQFNGADCDSLIEDVLVENNLLENNSWGMVMYYNVERAVVRNNTVVIEEYPETNDSDHTFIGIFGSADNIFKNNIFYSTRKDIGGVFVYDSRSAKNTFDYNLWKVNTDYWQYEGSGRGDFSSRLSSATGWEKNGAVNTVDPGFVDVENGLYYLNPDSPAIDNGEDGECASTDMDLKVRLENGNRCDMGMYEANE